MKLKNTLLLFVLAVGLFAFIRFYESHQESSREIQERAGKLVSFDRDKVDAIMIKNSESKIELRKDERGVWHVEAPVKDRADSMVISQLFTTAESLRHDAAIGDEKKGADKDQLKEYGLSNSETKVRFTGKDKPVELIFGKDAAVEGKVYVKLENSNTAYVIGKDLKEQISKKVDEFRDHKLTDINTEQVDRVTIKTSAGEIELEKKNQHWTVVKPLKVRGDDSKIRDLISQAATAHIEQFAGDAAEAGTLGLQEPRATLSLWTEGDKTPTTLQIGGNPKDDKEKTYVKASTREGAVLIPKSIEALIQTKPNDIRDKSLIRVEEDIIDRISIEGEGKEKIVLARSGESWVRKAEGRDEPVNVVAAKRLLEDVSLQEVTAFVSDVATDLPKYGLDHPIIKLTLSSYASENTAETKAGEKPIVALLFGKTENGNTFVRVEDEPFIVTVSDVVLGSILTDPLQWQPVEIFDYKPDDVTSLEISRPGQAAIALERDKEKVWKLAKGDGAVNQINAQSLINTLAKLRAVRWIGPSAPDFGLEQPLLTVAFKAGTASAKVVVGGDTPEGLSYAAVEGRRGAFGLSKPDVSALQLPLLEKAPAASAAPAVSPAVPVPLPQDAAAAPVAPAPATEAPSRPPAPQP